MGSPTAHQTGVTLASGDPSNSLTTRWGWSGSRPLEAAAPGFVLEAGRGRWRALAGEGGVGGPGGQDSWTQSGLLPRRGSSAVVFDPSDGGEGGRMEAPRRNLGRCGELLSGCCGWSGSSGHGGHRRGRGFVGGDLLVGFLQILLEDPDLILHRADQALHFGVSLFFEDLLDPTSGCDDVFHCPMTQFLHFCSQGPIQGSQEGVHSLAFGGFFVSGVESLGEFFRLARELHDVLGSLFQVFKRRPGFVPHRSDA